MGKKIPVVTVAEPEEAARLADLPLDATVAMADVAGAIKDGLLAFASAAGLMVMFKMMEAELTERIGPKHARIADREGNWHGTTTGSVVLGGRKVTAERLRGRSTGGDEIALDTWTVFSSEDLLTQLVVERMLAGVSTRRHQDVAEPIGGRVRCSSRVDGQTLRPWGSTARFDVRAVDRCPRPGLWVADGCRFIPSLVPPGLSVRKNCRAAGAVAGHPDLRGREPSPARRSNGAVDRGVESMSTELRYEELPASKRRLLILVAGLRALCFGAVVVTLYYLLPLDRTSGVALVVDLMAGLAVLVRCRRVAGPGDHRGEIPAREADRGRVRRRAPVPDPVRGDVLHPGQRFHRQLWSVPYPNRCPLVQHHRLCDRGLRRHRRQEPGRARDGHLPDGGRSRVPRCRAQDAVGCSAARRRATVGPHFRRSRWAVLGDVGPGPAGARPIEPGSVAQRQGAANLGRSDHRRATGHEADVSRRARAGGRDAFRGGPAGRAAVKSFLCLNRLRSAPASPLGAAS